MITVLLADDHPIVRKGLRSLLEGEEEIEVVAEAGDGLEAVRMTKEYEPDVLVVDLAMPGMDGLEVTRRVREGVPDTYVVVLSMHADASYVARAVRNGATGYVLKDSSADELVEAVRSVHRGRSFFSEKLSIDISPVDEGVTDRYETLTEREREVLHLVAEGHTSPEIAEKLFISPRTVDTHRSNLMAKLGIHSQLDLVRYALQRGLIPMGRPLDRQESKE